MALCLLAGFAYNVPPIHDRLAWRVENVRVAIKRYFNPPEQVLFVPQEQVDAIVQATLTAMAPTPTSTPFPITETALPLPSALIGVGKVTSIRLALTCDRASKLMTKMSTHSRLLILLRRIQNSMQSGVWAATWSCSNAYWRLAIRC